MTHPASSDKPTRPQFAAAWRAFCECGADSASTANFFASLDLASATSEAELAALDLAAAAAQNPPSQDLLDRAARRRIQALDALADAEHAKRLAASELEHFRD